MISVSLFVHPHRRDNIDKIIKAYSDYTIVDEVLIVTGSNVTLPPHNEKFKFVQMPGPYDWGGWPSFGLLARYTFALSCKNRFVFIQDDDKIFAESLLQELFNLNQPLAGTAGRWFDKEIYQDKKIKGKCTAPICLTSGLLIDTNLMPNVISYAKKFWKNYQQVFNGEDIFLSYAVSKLTCQSEFVIINGKKQIQKLPTGGYELCKNNHNSQDRSTITKNIVNFFNQVER